MALINTTTTGVLGSTFYGDGTGDLTIQQNGVTINQISSTGLLIAPMDLILISKLIIFLIYKKLFDLKN